MYTKGPWRFVRLSWGCQVLGGKSVVVAAIDLDTPKMPKKFREQRIADARLIAAAPRLLEAAQSMLEELMQDDDYSHFNGRVMELKAAIAAATGEGETQ